MAESTSVDKPRSVVFLVAALVMTVTWAIGATGWTKGLNIITFIGLGVILVGMMLARSILPGVIAHLFSVIIGLGWSFWVTSRLLPVHYTWLERWENLVGRLNYWYSQAVQGGTSYDNLMFILQMGVIVWGTGYLTIWFVYRSGKVWQAIVPGGLVLLINLYYAPQDITLWFLVYVMFSLLLVIRCNLINQETKWRAEDVFFHPDISFDFLRDGLIFSAIVLALAWIAPPVVDAKSLGLLDEFQGSWREFQGNWNRLYADLNYRDTLAFDTFGQSLSLGGPRRLTNSPVMDVQVSGIGRYWRASVYDEYTGVGWRSTDEQSAPFGPSRTLSLPRFEAREAVTQTYTLHRDGATVLYTMSNLVRLDRSAKIHFNTLSNQQISQVASPRWPGSGEPWVEEITYIRSNATVDRGESYQAVSETSRATVSQLQEAGTDYPAWITERYLQLPDTVTERTRELARQIADPYDTPYDKAQAIERYMRSEIKYNERLATPPPGIDRVDYILFTAREAYCDYYASSMIVMLRSLGIPARLAAGFARGTFNADLNAFQVINADAHSWVEVFFPRYGWVEFEPTAAQPIIIRPTAPEFDSSFASGAFPPGEFPGEDQFPGRPENIPIDEELFAGPLFAINLPWFGTTVSVPRSVVSGGVTIIGLAILLALAGGGLVWQQLGTKPTDSISKVYQRMVRLASWMGVTIRSWQTPYEHAATLQRSLPSRQREVDTIADEYVYQTYSPHPESRVQPDGDKDTQPAATIESNLAWSRLRSEMVKMVIKQRLPKWLNGRR